MKMLWRRTCTYRCVDVMMTGRARQVWVSWVMVKVSIEIRALVSLVGTLEGACR